MVCRSLGAAHKCGLAAMALLCRSMSYQAVIGQSTSSKKRAVLHLYHRAGAAPAQRLDHHLHSAPCQDVPAVQKEAWHTEFRDRSVHPAVSLRSTLGVPPAHKHMATYVHLTKVALFTALHPTCNVDHKQQRGLYVVLPTSQVKTGAQVKAGAQVKTCAPGEVRGTLHLLTQWARTAC